MQASKQHTIRPLTIRSLLPGFLRRMLPHLSLRARRRVGMALGVGLVVVAVACGVATYVALTAAPPFGKDPNTILRLLNIDLVVLLVLVSVIGWRLAGLWSGRRQRQAGAGLQVRLVLIFAFMAAMPAIIMTVFSATLFHYGLQSWFSEKVRDAIHQSEAFTEAYMAEHQQVIKADILAMANDLNRAYDTLANDPAEMDKFLQTQSFLRNFSEVVIFNGHGRAMQTAGLAYAMAFETMPQYAISQAKQGDVVMLSSAGDEQTKALVKLNNVPDAYLFAARMVDPTVRARLDATVKAVQGYEKLEAQRGDLQVKMVLIFVVVALILMLTAIWFGVMLARQLASPISGLITATDRVRAGDLTARVALDDSIDEFEVLGRAFNRMTSQIEDQRNELINANRQMDQRRRFTETVLEGVSSGVIGLDREDRITLANNSAAKLLQQESATLTGQAIGAVLPDVALLLEQSRARTSRAAQGEIPFHPADGSPHRSFLVRITPELIGEQDMGAVLTFDDITELQSAQRKAAWADVARRIAHEIKNPLTPIQLSAERLKRKYMKQITDDPETFAQCTDTIIHHVGDIGRMVNEFSSFARMPDAVLERENLCTIIRDIQVFQQQAHPEMQITLGGVIRGALPLYAHVDARQVRQALTNVIQNAIDSIQGAGMQGGMVHIAALPGPSGDKIAVIVNDNGPGLPPGVDPARLTEPYVTHREKGTGLGLAIVKKIMDDHKGKIILGVPEWVRAVKDWADLGGATSILVFPLDHVDAIAV